MVIIKIANDHPDADMSQLEAATNQKGHSLFMPVKPYHCIPDKCQPQCTKLRIQCDSA